MTKKWKLPPLVKILEALGTLADRRVKIVDNKGEVISSMQSKQYTIVYEPSTRRIFSNDNASRWQGYLGYPIIAFLCKYGVIDYDKKVAEALKGIEWKKLNDKFRSHKKVEEIARNRCEERGINREKIKKEQEKIMKNLKELDLSKMWRNIEVKKL